jgi:hypothetical protein
VLFAFATGAALLTIAFAVPGALTTSSKSGFMPPYILIVAVSSGSVSAGATVAVILVESTTVTPDSVRDPVFTPTVIWVAKQFEVALAGVV